MQEAQRLAALAVRRVLDGSTLAVALPPSSSQVDSSGRRFALVQVLTYGTLRYWGRYDALVRQLATKPIADRALASLVAVALYQLEHTRAPPFAVVDHAVDAAAAVARPAAKAVVDAMLRRFLRERDSLIGAIGDDPVAHYSHP